MLHIRTVLNNLKSLKILPFCLGVVGTLLNPVLLRQNQGDLCEFRISLVYTASVMTT